MWDEILKIALNSKVYIPFFTIIGMFVIIKIVNNGLNKLLVDNATKIETKKRNTIVTLATNLVKYIVILLGALIILSAWGINVTGILAGLGVAGLVAGLALQDALKDIIMGCNIIIDNFFVVGDYITFGDFTGEVIEFGLKNTKIRDSFNHVLVVANRNIDKVVNHSQGKFMIPISINVAYEERHEKVEKTIVDMLDDINKLELVKESKYVGLQNLGSSSVEYKIVVFCIPINQYQVEREVNVIVKNTLDKHGIKIPYNQLEVHNGK